MRRRAGVDRVGVQHERDGREGEGDLARRVLRRIGGHGGLMILPEERLIRICYSFAAFAGT